MPDILQNLGIPNNEDTLSTLGGPCHFDYKKLNYELPDACAICVTGTHFISGFFNTKKFKLLKLMLLSFTLSQVPQSSCGLYF